jgi:hypothetical protein
LKAEELDWWTVSFAKEIAYSTSSSPFGDEETSNLNASLSLTAVRIEKLICWLKALEAVRAISPILVRKLQSRSIIAEKSFETIIKFSMAAKA